MILAAFDVSSLAGWEWGEYISEALVIVACAGELVADLGRKCLTKEHRDRVERFSTIMLVAALSASLICLVRTNELSGTVIGSLGEKAEKADTKAQKAIADSSIAASRAQDALTKAGKSAESLGKAEDEADKAQTASSNALSLARGARQEADSFEKDIASAKTQAAAAESHLADALQRAANATAELERLRSPRSLTHAPDLVSALQAFEDTEYTFSGVFQDEDSGNLVRAIDDVLQRSGWKRVKPVHHFPMLTFSNKGGDFEVPVTLSTGIQISVDSSESLSALNALSIEKLPSPIRAAVVLNNGLFSSLFPPQETGDKIVHVETGTSIAVRITIGKKP